MSNEQNINEITTQKKDNELKESRCQKAFIYIFFIPTIIFILVLLSYLTIIPIKMEFHSVVIVGLIYVIFLSFIKHNAYYSVCSFKNRKKIVIKEINNYIEKNLITLMGQEKAIGTIDKFFNKLSKNLRNDNFAAVASGVFPTLGILGTFISIAISMPDFGVSSTDALNSEITKLLGGVGTAFYASIYGIFLSLLWIFFEKRGFSYIQKNIQETKELFQDKLWTQEEIQRANFIEQQTLNNDLQVTIKQSMSPEFIRNMNETIRGQSEMLLEILKEDKTLHEELRNTYKTVVEKFAEITDKQDNVIGKLDKSIENANQSYLNLSENVLKLESLSESLKFTYESITVQNTTSKQLADTLEKVSTTLSEKTVDIVSSIENIADDLVKSQNNMTTSSEKFVEIGTNMSNLINGLTETTNKQIIVSDKLDQSIILANNSYSTLSENITKLESLSQIFQTNYDAFTSQNESSKDIANVLKNVVESISKETKEIINAFAKTSENLSNTQNVMANMSEKLMNMTTGMQNVITGLNDTYKNTIEKQMESIKTTVNSLEMLYSKFNDNINNTLNSFENSAESIKIGGEKMIESIKSLNLQTIGNSISIMSKSLESLEGSMQTTSSNLDQSVNKFDEQFIEKLRYTFKVLDEEIGKVLSKIGNATKALVDTSDNIEENLEDFNKELLEKLEMVLSIQSQIKKDS